jgi:antirestriction protein ArdC
MNDPLSIQIHNRQRFEQNQPGEWLKLPATAEQLQEAMRSVGITAENPQDFFINGIDSPIPAVRRLPFEQVQAAPVRESEKPAEKLKEITDKLEQGITDIFASENYQNYLNTMSKFHDYSLNNTILIAMQKPDASHVAGFNTWKNEFERNVMKGQKGIKIIAPSPYKVKMQQEKTDPATGKPVIGADGKPVTEETERKIPAYKVVSVFDVSQTEGKELPTIGADMLTGDVERYADFFAALEQASPAPIGFEEIHSGAKGYYSHEDKRIAIAEGMSELQTLKTAVHEIAHARLHDIDLTAEQEQPRIDKRTREVEAESVAYAVCQHYGLDTPDYSFGYVAGWSSGKELTELKASLETIRKTAAEIINEVDGHFAVLKQGRKQTAVREQASATETLEQFAQDYAQAMTDFYREHPPFSETAQMTNTSPSFVAHSIEVGYTVDLHRALNAMEGHPGYAQAAGSLRARLETIAPIPQQEQAAEHEPQPGIEEWSEPANPDNGPDEPEDETNPVRTEPTPTVATYYSINEQGARRAKKAISFSDYRPGSATAEYRQSVDKAVEIAERQKARVDPMYHDKIDRLLDTYARKLAENMNHGYAITARVPSRYDCWPRQLPRAGQREAERRK